MNSVLVSIKRLAMAGVTVLLLACAGGPATFPGGSGTGGMTMSPDTKLWMVSQHLNHFSTFGSNGYGHGPDSLHLYA